VVRSPELFLRGKLVLTPHECSREQRTWLTGPTNTGALPQNA
jgi:hypothetical protein